MKILIGLLFTTKLFAATQGFEGTTLKIGGTNTGTFHISAANTAGWFRKDNASPTGINVVNQGGGAARIAFSFNPEGFGTSSIGNGITGLNGSSRGLIINAGEEQFGGVDIYSEGPVRLRADGTTAERQMKFTLGSTEVVTIQSPSFSSTLDGKLLLGPNIALYRNTGGSSVLQLSPSGGINGIESGGGGISVLSNGVVRMNVHAGEHWELNSGSIHIPGTSAQGIKWSIPTGTRPSIISPADATLEFNTGSGSDQKHVFKINTVEKARVDTNGVVTSRVSGLTGNGSTDGDALASSGGSMIQLDSAATAPTTNTRVARYTTVTVNTGSPNMTLTQDAALGDSVEIDKAGIYFISCTADDAGGAGSGQQSCITRNSAALTSTCDGQTTTVRLNWSSNDGDNMTFASWAGYLAVDDVIRCQNQNNMFVGNNFSGMKITMLGK